MSEQIKPYWIIVRRDNGHATTVHGNVMELFPDEESAKNMARQLAGKFHNTKFAIAMITWAVAVVPAVHEQPS